MGAWRSVLRRYAFAEYDGPPLEPLDLYRKKSGDELVGQLYWFVDKGNREVALRPEMTPTFARMVAARASTLKKPVRWFSIPQLFRYERQQKGRLREHFQLNVDIVGELDVTADAELLAIALDVMRELGLSAADVQARISDRRLLQALLENAGVAAESMSDLYAVIDKRGREPVPITREKLVKTVQVDALADKIERILEINDIGSLVKHSEANVALAPHVQRITDYMRYVDALGFGDWVKLDLSVVRGLAYYTGIVFELFDTAGEFRAICGGGRYDDLLDTLGGVDLPALGFGMGDVVLGELLRKRNLLPGPSQRMDYWVASDDETLLPDVMTVATRLRRAGRSVEYSLKHQQLSRQLKTATARGADSAVLLKREGMSTGQVTVRDLRTGSEQSLPLDDLTNSIQTGDG